MFQEHFCLGLLKVQLPRTNAREKDDPHGVILGEIKLQFHQAC